jgi:hypothetical protein
VASAAGARTDKELTAAAGAGTEEELIEAAGAGPENELILAVGRWASVGRGWQRLRGAAQLFPGRAAAVAAPAQSLERGLSLP